MTRGFREGVLWNFGSLAVLGLSGIGLNVVVARAYDAATLGVFNQVLAAYVVASMLAAGGLHVSLLRSIATETSEAGRAASLLGGLVPMFVLAAGVAFLFWALRDVIGSILKSPDVSAGIAAVVPGLFFFAINKALLSVVNALERMRAFAVLQSLRYFLILGALAIAIAIELPGPLLSAVFSFGETILFVVLMFEVSRQIPWWRGRNWATYSATHLRYGAKSVVSGLLSELNSRVDVLMIGLFMDDTAVGIYSFAVLFAEGFFQILVVLQNSYNPILARHLSLGETDAVRDLARRARRVVYPATAAAGLLSMLVYPHILLLMTGREALGASHGPYVILVSGIILASGYLPFLGLLLMANLPGWHTVLMVATVLSNVLGNAVFIPTFGIWGAALGTAVAFVLAVILLQVLAGWRSGVRL